MPRHSQRDDPTILHALPDHCKQRVDCTLLFASCCAFGPARILANYITKLYNNCPWNRDWTSELKRISIAIFQLPNVFIFRDPERLLLRAAGCENFQRNGELARSDRAS
jgi:hypothetical protein